MATIPALEGPPGAQNRAPGSGGYMPYQGKRKAEMNASGPGKSGKLGKPAIEIHLFGHFFFASAFLGHWGESVR
jgi:hypothetical protein